MRRALEEYRILGVKTNIPFHQRIMDSPRFIGGQFDTRFIEERFSMDTAPHEGQPSLELIAAVMATVVAHHEIQLASQIVRHGGRDTSNWKWLARWERLKR
jgi:acetyl/propionyl-CoA carboxylase alpha subunit